MFKGTQKQVTEIEVRDLDDAITEFLKSKGFTNKNFDKYGYEAIAENCWNNYEEHSFDVSPSLPDDYDLERMGRNEAPDTSTLLDWMCADGLIEAGEYLVDCSW